MTKSPVYGYLPQPSMLDMRGSLAGVFFVSGCNFRCRFCHNPELMKVQDNGLSWEDLRQVCRLMQENWADAAVITGGEPTLSDQLRELIAFLREFSFKIKLDTNGSRPSVLREVLPLVDYVAMDVKSPLEDYAWLTGCAGGEAVAESIAALIDGGVPYEFRTTVIEEFHTDERVKRMRKQLEGAKRCVLQPFIPRDTLPDPAFRSYRRTSPARLEELRELFKGYVEEVEIR